MNTTTNFGLCQWEPGDRILREDFNGDNAKIDAKLKAVADSNPYRRILSVVTQTGAQQIDLDVSGIDFTQYHKIELFVDSPGMTSGYSLRLNGTSTSAYSSAPIGANGGGGASSPDVLVTIHSTNCGLVQFYSPLAAAKVGCAYMTFNGTSYNGYQSISKSVTWSALTAFNIIGGAALSAGTKIELFGVSK